MVDGEGGVPSVSGFVIGAGANADFTDLNIKDLKQAIVNNGTIGSIDHMTFENNVVETTGSAAKGGAIANSGTIGTISDSVFVTIRRCLRRAMRMAEQSPIPAATS